MNGSSDGSNKWFGNGWLSPSQIIESLGGEAELQRQIVDSLTAVRDLRALSCYDALVDAVVEAMEAQVAVGGVRQTARATGLDPATVQYFRERARGMERGRIIHIGNTLSVDWSTVLDGQLDMNRLSMNAMTFALGLMQQERRRAKESVTLELSEETYRLVEELAVRRLSDVPSEQLLVPEMREELVSRAQECSIRAASAGTISASELVRTATDWLAVEEAIGWDQPGRWVNQLLIWAWLGHDATRSYAETNQVLDPATPEIQPSTPSANIETLPSTNRDFGVSRWLNAGLVILVIALSIALWFTHRNSRENETQIAEVVAKLRDSDAKLDRLHAIFVTTPPTEANEARRKAMEVITDDNKVSADPEKRFVAGRAARIAAVDLLESGQHGRATTMLNEAIGLLARLVDEDLKNPLYRRELMLAYNNQGNHYRRLNKYTEAIQSYRRAFAEHDELIKLSDNSEYLIDKARIGYNLGSVFFDQKKYALAKAEFERAIEIRKPLVDERTIHPDSLKELGQTFGFLALSERNVAPPNLDAAEAAYEKTIYYLEKAVKAERTPANVSALGHAYAGLASTYASKGKDGHARAIPLFKKGIDELEAAVNMSPRVASYRHSLGNAQRNFSAMYAAQNDFESAARFADEAFNQQILVVEIDNVNDAFRRDCMKAYEQVLSMNLMLGRFTQVKDYSNRLPRRCFSGDADYAIVAGMLTRLMVAHKAPLPDDVRKELTDHFNNKAMDLLKEAVDKGLRDGKVLAIPIFDPLRMRKDFQEIVKTIELRSKPPQ